MTLGGNADAGMWAAIGAADQAETNRLIAPPIQIMATTSLSLALFSTKLLNCWLRGQQLHFLAATNRMADRLFGYIHF